MSSSKKLSQANKKKSSADDDMTRLNVHLEADLYAQIKVRCALERRSITDITRELWVTYLKTKL